MRWQGGRRSTNVEDRRGARGPMVIGGGLGTIVLLLLFMCMGGDPRALLQQMEQANPQGQGVPGAPADPADEPLKEFVSVVLADTEDVWGRIFPQEFEQQYREPTLVLFNGQVRSACGFADAAVGPFYCPADDKLYLDFSFFRDLEAKLNAPGDFAQAYVIAHEVGHHVQNQLGISDMVRRQQQGLSQVEANQLSVRLELQADFFAGVWAHHAQKARQILESGDIEEGLQAASQIGDDRLQRQARGYVVPDSFTHGSSEQRVRWFRKGLETGDVSQGDTFNAREL